MSEQFELLPSDHPELPNSIDELLSLACEKNLRLQSMWEDGDGVWSVHFVPKGVGYIKGHVPSHARTALAAMRIALRLTGEFEPAETNLPKPIPPAPEPKVEADDEYGGLL